MNNTIKTLIVEDDKLVAASMADALSHEGYNVLVVSEGDGAVDAVRSFEPHIIVLDLMLPGLNGFEITAKVRKFSNAPIIVVTARDTEEDEDRILEMGADDFLPKPLRPSRLIRYIEVNLRRMQTIDSALSEQSGKIIENSQVNIKIDIDRRKVTRIFDNTEYDIILTPTEFMLLCVFMKSIGKVFSREFLLKEVWNWDNAQGTRTVDSHIKSLRKKLTACGGSDPIKTIHGVGYTFNI